MHYYQEFLIIFYHLSCSIKYIKDDNFNVHLISRSCLEFSVTLFFIWMSVGSFSFE